MQHTIESFVKTLQEDGIAAGKAAGEQKRREALTEAEKIISQARSEAEHILKEAHNKRIEAELRQSQELSLAARDAVLTLQQRLCNAVTHIIDLDAAAVLGNNDQLAHLIEEVAKTFASQQSQHPEDAIVFKVASEDARQIVQKAIGNIALRPGASNTALFKAETGLGDLGFEYRQGGNVVEVTPQTVVTLLTPLVSDEVGRRIAAVMNDNAISSECHGGHSEQ